MKKILESGLRHSSSVVLCPPLCNALRHHPSDSASHNNTILIISNDVMKDIIKIVKFLQDTRLLPEGVSETIQNEAKEQRRGFLSILLGTLGASLLGNNLTGKRAIAKSGIEETKSKKQG